MQKQAKYMRKRPVVREETRSCLTKDDMGLRVIICHIRWEIGLNRSSHFGCSARVSIDKPLQLSNPKSISLLMQCCYFILTSLTSQALLQAALDKEATHLLEYSAHREF
jgi:hypothetical protein